MASYDRDWVEYSLTRHADARIVEHVTTLLPPPIGSRLVDAGAGTGNYSNAGKSCDGLEWRRACKDVLD